MNLFDILDGLDFLEDVGSIFNTKKSLFQVIKDVFLLILFLVAIFFLILETLYLRRLESPITFVTIFSLLGIVMTILYLGAIFKLNLIQYINIKKSLLLFVIFISLSIVIGSYLNRINTSKIDNQNETRWFKFKNE